MTLLETELSRVLSADPEEAANDLPFQTWSPMPFGRIEAVISDDGEDEPLDFLAAESA
ncbi:MAG: hypothetical protein QM817_02695 [Archangium sp.]